MIRALKAKYKNAYKNYVRPNEDKWEWKRVIVRTTRTVLKRKGHPDQVIEEPEYDYYKIIVRRKITRRRRKRGPKKNLARYLS